MTGVASALKCVLFLYRKQFPALPTMTSVIPTMTPVIPAWQLQQNSAGSDIVESRAETNICAELCENSYENSIDTKPPLTTLPETTDDQTTDSVTDKLEITHVRDKPEITHVKDKLEITQPDTIQVDMLRIIVSNLTCMLPRFVSKKLPSPFCVIEKFLSRFGLSCFKT